MVRFEPAGPPRYAHQRQGLAKMIATGGVTALLFDPGTGKTAVVLDYASLLALKSPRGEARVLVVAPLAAVDTWVLQAGMFVSQQVHLWVEALGGSILQRAQALASRGGSPFPAQKGSRRPGSAPRALHHRLSHTRMSRGSGGALRGREGPDGLGTDKPRLVIEIVNIDTMASRATTTGPRGGRVLLVDVMLSAIRRFDPDLVVVDESHKIKSPTGNASRAMSRVADFVRRRVILTGTVMPHSPMDVFGQWRFLEPYAFGATLPDGTVRRATQETFKSRYVEMGGWMGKEVIGFRNLDDMQDIMAKNAVVVRKSDALDLPKTTEVTIPVVLSPDEATAYTDMTDTLVAALATGTVTAKNRLAQMMRLRQITSGFVPDDNGVIREIGSTKVDTIRSLIYDTLTGEKRIVVFALFRPEITRLAKALVARRGEEPTEVMTISGATSVSDRTLMRKRFGSDDPTRMVMVAQVKTMSLAVNELVTANHAVFASLSQQRDDLIQAMDRLDRIGQTRPVTFWFALAPGTVDEVIVKSHRERTDLEDAMLAHIHRVHALGLSSDPSP